MSHNIHNKINVVLIIQLFRLSINDDVFVTKLKKIDFKEFRSSKNITLTLTFIESYTNKTLRLFVQCNEIRDYGMWQKKKIHSQLTLYV